AEVESKRNPPDEVIDYAHHDRGEGPRASYDELEQTDGAKDLSREAHGREHPALLGPAGNFEVDHSIEPDDHAEAGEDLRMTQRRHAGKTEEPLRIEHRKNAPADIIQSGCAKNGAVQSSPGDEDGRLSVHQGFLARASVRAEAPAR